MSLFYIILGSHTGLLVADRVDVRVVWTGAYFKKEGQAEEGDSQPSEIPQSNTSLRPRAGLSETGVISHPAPAL